jgi:sugar lactone lactonase YvrE
MRWCALIALALGQDRKYVIVSSPTQASVMYWQPTDIGDNIEENSALYSSPYLDPRRDPQPLISEGLESPVGLAMDQARHGLYVADPQALKIYRYIVTATSTGLMVGEAVQVVSNFQARWVAVDSHGNLFFSDEQNNAIYKVDKSQLVNPATNFLEGETVAHYIDDEVAEPVKLYDASKTPEVSAPGGVAVDNYRVFWTNKVLGTQHGSVVQGFEEPPPGAPTLAEKVADNTLKVYGVCLSHSNIYFTDDKTFMYGMKKVGGAIATISEKMKGPRGCAFDGDGTVYFADETGNAVMSLPGNIHNLAPMKLHKAFTLNGPFGLAVFNVVSSHAAVAALLATSLVLGLY